MPTPIDYRNPATKGDRPRRSRVVLKALACVIIGTALGAACTVGLWLALGGWGPPDGLIFTGLGFILGFVRANAISARP